MRELAERFWDAVARQDAEALAAYFTPDAVVRWHCTGEQFTADGFIRANCGYPGSWQGKVERVEPLSGGMCTVAHVWSDSMSCHAVSFFRLTEDGKIAALDEYWGDDGPAPQWRQEMQVSRPME